MDQDTATETWCDPQPALAAGGGPEEKIDLDALVAAFVELYGGMKQRDPSWYLSMGVTVGGSEIAALLGMDSYKTRADVVASKVDILTGGSGWGGGGPACWWGVLFEDIIAAYVAVDLGGVVRGEDICVQELPGHRNSPDGYIVGKFYLGVGGQQHLWTTDMDPDGGYPLTEKVLLLEFKCPVSRKPALAVPRQYRAQMWSGLMVSPVAHLGLFVDAVFRKCGLPDLGDTPEYDTAYHRRDAEERPWRLPVAWSLVGVYAPLLDAPRGVRYGWRGAEWAPGDPPPDDPDADAAQAACRFHAAHFGQRTAPPARGPPEGVVDLGVMPWAAFDRVLGMVNSGRFPIVRVAPCFADGRGHPLHSGDEVADAVELLRWEAPADHWLLGVLPWKLFQVDYVFAERRPDFADEVAPLIAEVHRQAAEAIASGDPAAYLAALKREGARPPDPSAAPSAEDVQDLFDSISGGGSP